MAEILYFTAAPSDLELLEFFESEPVEVVPEDGYWCYEFTDSYNVGVRLSTINATRQATATRATSRRASG